MSSSFATWLTGFNYNYNQTIEVNYTIINSTIDQKIIEFNSTLVIGGGTMDYTNVAMLNQTNNQ
jgi:hypothetical protein